MEVVPEIVAEAATYAQSYERRNGLHFLVDVGEADIQGALLNVADFRYMDNAASDGGPGSPPSDDPQEEGGPPAAVKARLGVAYGLSLPDVGSITPPARIGDIKPPPPKPGPPLPDYWGGKQ